MNVFTKIKGDKKAVFCVLDLKIDGDACDFGVFKVSSRDLATHLAGCKKVILFAATIGAMFDRELYKQSKLSPYRAYELQQEGSREIERLCDTLCEQLANDLGRTLRARFSPGYGDLSLKVQREIFRVLEPAKHIGLCLGDSCIMSPSKSVTAFVGVENE